MATKRKNTSGRFSKGISGNPAGRPPGSRNHATLLMESLLEGESEQLTRKVVELARAGDITALRLCLERLLPPRKDRTIHLNLPPIENAQQISLAMAKVSAAIGEGEITPTEGEVLANVFAAQKAFLLTGDLERRIDDLDKRLSQTTRASTTPPYASGVQTSNPGTAAVGNANLAKRLMRLEQRLGPPPTPLSQQVFLRAWIYAFTEEELARYEDRWEAAGTSGPTDLLDIFEEGTAERQDVLHRLEPVLDAFAREMTGKSYAELLQEEAENRE